MAPDLTPDQIKQIKTEAANAGCPDCGAVGVPCPPRCPAARAADFHTLADYLDKGGMPERAAVIRGLADPAETSAHDNPHDLGTPKTWRVTRDGDRDLAFDGWELGEGTHGTGGTSGYECDWNRGVKVTVFLTTGHNLVTQVHRWSCYQGEDDRSEAAAHDSPDHALQWLRATQSRGELGPASKEAWEAACAAWPPLKGADVEQID